MGIAASITNMCFPVAPPGVSVPTNVPDVVTRHFDDISIHVVNTGWVRVKTAHRSYDGPAALRFPAIAFGRQWTELMPVLVTVIEHAEGVYLVDAGLSEATMDEAHFASDPATAFIYGHFLDFRFAPEQRIDRRLQALGIDPARVRSVVLTHRHADHSDAVAHLDPRAEIFVGAADWPTHAGALPIGFPSGEPPTLVRSDEGAPLGAFPHVRPLTSDGRVAIVPLAGHSPGHLGVVVRTPDLDVVIAGDATFSLEDLEARRIAGIVEVPALARRTLDTLADHIVRYRSSLLLSHDPVLLDRFRRAEPTEALGATTERSAR